MGFLGRLRIGFQSRDESHVMSDHRALLNPPFSPFNPKSAPRQQLLQPKIPPLSKRLNRNRVLQGMYAVLNAVDSFFGMSREK